MRLTTGTRTRIIADLAFEFDPAAATVELEVDGDGVWHPAEWLAPAVAGAGTWARSAQTVEFFVGGPEDAPGDAIVLAPGRHLTRTRVTDGGDVHEAPSTIIDVVAVGAFVTVGELVDTLANAGGAGSRTAANLPDDRLAANLEEATSETLGGLAGYQVTTGAAAPPLLRSIVLAVAAYLSTLEFFGSQPLEDRDPVVLRYARAEKLLARLSSGDLAIGGVESGGQTGAPSGEPAIYQPPGQANIGLADVFNPDAWPSHPNMAPYTGGPGGE